MMKASFFMPFFQKNALNRFLGALSILLAITTALALLSHRSPFALPSILTEPSDGDVPVTVILDAGHGGEDGGTASKDGTLEKDLNLQIAKQLCELLKANGIKTLLTRSEDTLLYDKTTNYIGRKKALDLAARRKLADETPNCIFVSIHMNAFPGTQSRGLQVWYSPNDPLSQALAASIQEAARAYLLPDNDRQIKQATSAIYLLHHIQAPAVLVECGFLSNPEDAALLASPTYQQALALVLFTAILENV